MEDLTYNYVIKDTLVDDAGTIVPANVMHKDETCARFIETKEHQIIPTIENIIIIEKETLFKCCLCYVENSEGAEDKKVSPTTVNQTTNKHYCSMKEEGYSFKKTIKHS